MFCNPHQCPKSRGSFRDFKSIKYYYFTALGPIPLEKAWSLLLPANDLTLIQFKDAVHAALVDEVSSKRSPCSECNSALAAMNNRVVCHTRWNVQIDDSAIVAHQLEVESLGHS